MDTLVLDAGLQPVDTREWTRALALVLKDRARVVEVYADRLVESAALQVAIAADPQKYGDWSGEVPAVVVLNRLVKFRRGVRFSRDNVFLRDKGRCQYCGVEVTRSSFTYDHVIPRTQGGVSRWENVVVCCERCNRQKGGRTPQEARMRLLATPTKPRSLPTRSMKLASRGSVPKSWEAYLRDTIYWHGELVSEDAPTEHGGGASR